MADKSHIIGCPARRNSADVCTCPPADDKKTLAAAILNISAAMVTLRKSGLNRAAIVVLLKDATGEPKVTIARVLDGLEQLKKDYCA